MTALNRDNIPSSINTLEGLAAWAILAYTAAYGGKTYAERDTTDNQRYSRYSIAPVTSQENNTSLFLVARLAVPVEEDVLATAGIVWDNVVEHSQQVSLPAGYLA